jgi:hypothetical protein
MHHDVDVAAVASSARLKLSCFVPPTCYVESAAEDEAAEESGVDEMMFSAPAPVDEEVWLRGGYGEPVVRVAAIVEAAQLIAPVGWS